MLVGLPSVTTHVGSIAELARDGETALVVPPQQVPQLRDAIRKLLDSEELRKRLGSAARRHCEARFSYEGMLNEMERIYREASGRPAGQ